ncbi:MAG: hypothetical protein M1832_004786 [Thelocarpon impressellum]|nr:MAG: hypothetical protein M1832_004786 [Thelocarpon impressellum]
MEAIIGLTARDAVVGASPPPPGVTPNFVNPVFKYGGTTPLCVIFMILSTIFLAMRLHTKINIVRKFGIEDDQQNNGQGRHIWDIPLSVYLIYLKNGMASIVFYCPATMFAKVAILLFYRRLSPKRGFRIVVDVNLAVVVGFNIALVICLIFGCRPIAKTWDPRITDGSCVDQAALFLANCIFNAVSDLAIFVVPIPMLAALNMPLRQKLSVAALFAVGSLTVIACIIRLKYQVKLLASIDPTWDYVTPTSWVIVETHLAIICGCLLVMKPFLRRYAPFLISSDKPSADPDSLDKSASPWHKTDYKSRITSKRSGPWGMTSGVESVDDDVERGPNVELASAKPRRSDDLYHESLSASGVGRNGLSESEEHIVPNSSAEEPGIVKTVNIDVR